MCTVIAEVSEAWSDYRVFEAADVEVFTNEPSYAVELFFKYNGKEKALYLKGDEQNVLNRGQRC